MSKGKLRTEKSGKWWSSAGRESDVAGGKDGFQEVKEVLNSCNSSRDTGVENVSMLAKMRMGADSVKVMQRARKRWCVAD